MSNIGSAVEVNGSGGQLNCKMTKSPDPEFTSQESSSPLEAATNFKSPLCWVLSMLGRAYNLNSDDRQKLREQDGKLRHGEIKWFAQQHIGRPSLALSSKGFTFTSAGVGSLKSDYNGLLCIRIICMCNDVQEWIVRLQSSNVWVEMCV